MWHKPVTTIAKSSSRVVFLAPTQYDDDGYESRKSIKNRTKTVNRKTSTVNVKTVSVRSEKISVIFEETVLSQLILNMIK